MSNKIRTQNKNKRQRRNLIKLAWGSIFTFFNELAMVIEASKELHRSTLPRGTVRGIK